MFLSLARPAVCLSCMAKTVTFYIVHKLLFVCLGLFVYFCFLIEDLNDQESYCLSIVNALTLQEWSLVSDSKGLVLSRISFL